MGRKTSIYMTPPLERMAKDKPQKLAEALYRGLAVDALLIEENEEGGFTTHWYCPVPEKGTKFRVLHDRWIGTNDRPIREIYQIEITQPNSAE